jgi:pyruvate/2-oxoglutarate dehydrogenase complex dihydrolipoamide acyltransferase (E2) component
MKSLKGVAMAVIFAAATVPASAQTPAPPATKPAATTPAPAATPATPAAKPAATPATNPQNERMKVCNDKATGMKGDERKTYMSSCLAGKEPPKKLTAQQQRMTDCNAKAGDMKGDDRKKFMSECLKAKT